MGLRISGKSSSKPCLELGMVLVLLCLHVVLSFAFSRWLSLEEGACWFCQGLLLPGWVRGFAALSCLCRRLWMLQRIQGVWLTCSESGLFLLKTPPL